MSAAPAGSAAIRVAGLGKRFGQIHALEDVDLVVPTGQFVSLFGPNGSGKTTLVRVLATLSRPSSGRVEIFGQSIVETGPDLRRRIGVVSHVSFLNGTLTPDENLRFYARMFRLDDVGRRVDRALELVDLRHRRHDPVRTFSRGLAQRCAIARALLHEPEILLLDEPFSGLDPDAADRLDDLLRRARGHSTVLLTGHELARGFELADRVAILSEGRLVRDVSRDSIPAGDIVSLYREAIGRR